MLSKHILLGGKVFAGCCPVCKAVFFVCTADVIAYKAREIAEMRREGIAFEWIDNEDVDERFELCEHMKEAREFRQSRDDWKPQEDQPDLYDEDWRRFWDRLKGVHGTDD